MRLAWTEPAIRDLQAARAFIARDNPGAAAAQMEHVLTAVSGLVDFPHRSRPGRRPGTRELVVPRTAFVVPYRVRGEVIEILRVLHGRRRWPDDVEA